MSWGEFAKREPELARFGAGRLTAAPAYLVTVRRSGAPMSRYSAFEESGVDRTYFVSW